MAVSERKKRLPVTLPVKLHEVVMEHARELGKSASALVAELVERAYRENGRYRPEPE